MMERFDFAGFTFPRHIPQLVRPDYCGEPAPLKRLREQYESRRQAGDFVENAGSKAILRPHHFKVSASYYAAPRPYQGSERNRGASYYLESDFAPGLRWQWADEVEGAGIRHNGWYTDDEGTGQTIRGVVLRLPHGRGFLAGHSMGAGMSTSLEYHIYTEETEAAHAADSMAERVAESERDREREYRAGQRYAGLGGDMAEELDKRRGFRRARQTAPDKDARRVLSNAIAESLERTEELNRERQELFANYTQGDAWNEGVQA